MLVLSFVLGCFGVGGIRRCCIVHNLELANCITV